MHKSHLYPEKRGQYDVGKYDQVNFIEKTSGHQYDQNEVHDGEDPQSDTLHYGVCLGQVVVHNDHGDRDGDEDTQ